MNEPTALAGSWEPFISLSCLPAWLPSDLNECVNLGKKLYLLKCLATSRDRHILSGRLYLEYVNFSPEKRSTNIYLLLGTYNKTKQVPVCLPVGMLDNIRHFDQFYKENFACICLMI